MSPTFNPLLFDSLLEDQKISWSRWTREIPRGRVGPTVIDGRIPSIAVGRFRTCDVGLWALHVTIIS